MSVPSVDSPHVVNQQPINSIQLSADANQATLQAFSSILAQQLEKQESKLRGQREQLEQKLEEKQ